MSKDVMIKTKNTLVFLAQKNACIFLYAATAGEVRLIASRPVSVDIADSCGNIVGHGTEISVKERGIYRAILNSDNLDECDVEIEHTKGIAPFIMPGTGVLWNHGGIFPLLLKKGQPHVLYTLNDRSFPDKAICIKGIDYGEMAKISDENGSILTEWYPKMERPWFWHSAEFSSDEKYFTTEIETSRSDIRYTVWNAFITLLDKPENDFQTGRIRLAAYDETGIEIDARYEFYVGGERVAMYDALAGEYHAAMLPVGRYNLKVAHGFCFSTFESVVDISSDHVLEIKPVLKRLIELPEGWAFGELHTHSAFEDATMFPKQIMKAARVNGCNFCFLTDKDIDLLLKYGVGNCDIPGKFLGLPGQEIMCHELHMNVLNVDRKIPNPESDNLSKINPDINEKISGWIRAYEEIKAVRPCTIMHNHPVHEPKSQTMPYFRSWWVSDCYSDFHLVENFDYTGWFDRLNRGRVLFGAWTGDSHDCSLMHPGKEGICVHVGNELSAGSIIDALDSGRFFSLKAPGVFLDIKVGDTMMGGTFIRGEAVVKAEILALSIFPIDIIELVSNGKVVSTHRAEGAVSVSFNIEIPCDSRWVIARIKLTGSEWDAGSHSFKPLMTAGYDAFTNPIFIKYG